MVTAGMTEPNRLNQRTDTTLNTEKMLAELKHERERLARAIAALEGANSLGTVKKATVASMRPMKVKGKQGGALTPEGRRRISLAMKKRWAERKKMGS